jgi:type 1 fimbriae regulatory protein FimE
MSADAEIDASFRNTVLSTHAARTTRTLMVAAFGIAAKFQFAVHPHMLRHACGYKLANQGMDTRSLQHYLGHRNITHTVRYSELSPDRFKDFWGD